MEEQKRKRLTATERKNVFDMFGGRCAYCGTDTTFRGMQIDHKIPLRLNGSDEMENMLPACRSCKACKGAMDVDGFRAYLEEIPKMLARDSVAYQVGRRFELVKEAQAEVKFLFEKEQTNDGE